MFSLLLFQGERSEDISHSAMFLPSLLVAFYFCLFPSQLCFWLSGTVFYINFLAPPLDLHRIHSPVSCLNVSLMEAAWPVMLPGYFFLTIIQSLPYVKCFYFTILLTSFSAPPPNILVTFLDNFGPWAPKFSNITLASILRDIKPHSTPRFLRFGFLSSVAFASPSL